VTVRILDGEVFDAEVEARAVRAAAAAEAERVRGELSHARADAARELARARAEADAARAEAARVRQLAGLPSAGGQVTELTGLTVRARCPGVTVGEVVAIERAGVDRRDGAPGRRGGRLQRRHRGLDAAR
jgi:regulator of protease activity HflC (stomatin/prohibitin superfamily)